jgi:TatA/E family protein of Tat protein translocase
MFGLGFGELIIILVIALIFIGPKKLPELAEGLGKGIKEFQKAAKGFSDQVQGDHSDTPRMSEDKPKLVDANQQNEQKDGTSSDTSKNESHS